MTTKFNGTTPAELFAEAIKGTVEEAVTPVLEELAEMEVRFNGRLDGLQSQSTMRARACKAKSMACRGKSMACRAKSLVCRDKSTAWPVTWSP